MAPRTKKRPSAAAAAAAAEDYTSDNGFVAADSDTERPKTKKAKVGKEGKKGDKGKENGAVGGGKVAGNGEEYWELSGTRRVAISEFKGNRMINIREYYEKDGESLPGKKGISLPLAQFNTLVTLLPHIEAVLKGKGETVPRPDYKGELEAKDGNGVKEEEEEEGRGGGSVKKNFEETSDEEE